MSFQHHWREERSGKYHQVTMTGDGTKCIWTKVLAQCPHSCQPLWTVYTDPSTVLSTIHFAALLPDYSARRVLPEHQSLCVPLKRSINVPATQGNSQVTSSTLHSAFTQLHFVLSQVPLAQAVLQMGWSVCSLVNLRGILHVWIACHSQSCRFPPWHAHWHGLIYSAQKATSQQKQQASIYYTMSNSCKLKTTTCFLHISRTRLPPMNSEFKSSHNQVLHVQTERAKTTNTFLRQLEGLFFFC